MLILTEFCTLNILKAKNSGQSLSEQKAYRQRACKICIWASTEGVSLQFSQLGGLAGSAAGPTLCSPRNGGLEADPEAGTEDGFLQIYYLHARMKM